MLIKKCKITSPTRSKFFFSDNGSTAVEIALKMAYQCFRNIGTDKRNSFLCLKGGYHGYTFGAMNIAGRSSQYHSTFSGLFFNTHPTDVPEYYEGVEKIEEQEDKILKEWEQKLLVMGDRVCAISVEPVLQGAAGMKSNRSEFLEKLICVICPQGILVIVDEVMTRFYRTGKMCAMDHTNVIPDFVCHRGAFPVDFCPLA
jgi:adenosylmethionine-8-amino-7-oxononanoate aminotransferase